MPWARELTEGRVYWGLLFPRDEFLVPGSHSSSQQAAGTVTRPGSWELMSSTAAQSRKQTGRGARLGTLQASSSDIIPPTRLHLLKIPSPPQTEPSTGDKMIKHLTLLGGVSHSNYYLNQNIRNKLSVTVTCFKTGPQSVLSIKPLWLLSTGTSVIYPVVRKQ